MLEMFCRGIWKDLTKKYLPSNSAFLLLGKLAQTQNMSQHYSGDTTDYSKI